MGFAGAVGSAAALRAVMFDQPIKRIGLPSVKNASTGERRGGILRRRRLLLATTVTSESTAIASVGRHLRVRVAITNQRNAETADAGCSSGPSAGNDLQISVGNESREQRLETYDADRSRRYDSNEHA